MKWTVVEPACCKGSDQLPTFTLHVAEPRAAWDLGSCPDANHATAVDRMLFRISAASRKDLDRAASTAFRSGPMLWNETRDPVRAS